MKRRHKLVATSAAVMVLAGTGAGVAAADAATSTATGHGQSTPTANHHHHDRSLLQRALHGQITVRAKRGYHSVAMQRGRITAIHNRTVTVTSRDHYQHTYSTDSHTHVRNNKARSSTAKLAVGENALVITNPTTGVNTASRIVAHTPKKQNGTN